MRYLPLSDADRSEMLRVVGASSIDDLFRDVPEELRLKGPIEGLPPHASEMAVERHMTALSRKNMVAGDVPLVIDDLASLGNRGFFLRGDNPKVLTTVRAESARKSADPSLANSSPLIVRHGA